MNPVYFSDPFVLAVKDQLRDMRYRIKHSAGNDRARLAERGALRVPRPVALAADAVFSQVEAVATAWLPGNTATAAVFPFAVDAIFANKASGVPLFTPQIYRAVTTLMRRFGVSNFLIAEQAIDEARADLLRRHGDLVACALGNRAARASSDHRTGPPASRQSAIIDLCAAVAAALAAARPLKKFSPPEGGDNPKNLFLSPNAYCFCVIGLAIAIMSLAADTEASDKVDIVASADLAVGARFAQFTAALRSRDPQRSLAREFAAILPFLP